MSPWAAHFASGNVLFSGIALLIVASIAAWRPARRPSRQIRRLGMLVAGLLIAASATPLPGLSYAAWFVTVLGLVLLDRESEQSRVRRWRRVTAGINVSLALLVALGEARTLLSMSPARDPLETVYVIGDSVSAGMGDAAEDVWPAVMGRKNGVHVVNLAREGATARSALQQAGRIDEMDCLVIVEIGGNDLLGGVSSSQFDRDLAALLQELSAPDRRIVLMELPLPPLFNEYGRVQRRLAREYDAALISKRVFASVLATPHATVDSVHLSPAGHQLMADQVWDCVKPLLAGSSQSVPSTLEATPARRSATVP